VRATFDPADEVHGGPFLADTEVVGLYPLDVAAVAGRATACDPGSGPTRLDD
jgi:hypothetical protein